MAGPRGSVPLPGLRPAVNGEVVQDGRTHPMVYTIGDTLSLISHSSILRSGDLLATGMRSGGRDARTPATSSSSGRPHRHPARPRRRRSALAKAC